MGLKDWIAVKVLNKEGTPMLGNLMGKVSGQKTYITVGLGIAVAVVGHFWGPLDIGPIDIPQVSSGDMWKLIWEGISVAFLRHGVSKTSTPS